METVAVCEACGERNPPETRSCASCGRTMFRFVDVQVTTPAGTPTQRRRPLGMTVLAVLALLGGAVLLLGASVRLVNLCRALSALGSRRGELPPQVVSAVRVTLISWSVGWVNAAAMLIGGIGLLRQRRWGRTALLVYAGLLIVLIAVRLFFVPAHLINLAAFLWALALIVLLNRPTWKDVLR